MSDEMRKALEADGEKLRQLTGEDHGPWSDDPVSLPDRLRAIADAWLPDAVKPDLLSAAEDIEFNDAAFDMRWAADRRAIERWQKANPGNDLVWPDHADLVVWLMDELVRIKP